MGLSGTRSRGFHGVVQCGRGCPLPNAGAAALVRSAARISGARRLRFPGALSGTIIPSFFHDRIERQCGALSAARRPAFPQSTRATMGPSSQHHGREIQERRRTSAGAPPRFFRLARERPAARSARATRRAPLGVSDAGWPRAAPTPHQARRRRRAAEHAAGARPRSGLA